MDRKHDIFLSYSRFDELAVTRLHNELEDRGVLAWLDQKDIDPGAFFEDRIFSEIERCRCYGIALSRNSIKSEWVAREYAFAKKLFLQKKIRMAPFLLEDGLELPADISSHNVLSLVDDARRLQWLNYLIFPGITGRRVSAVFVNQTPSPAWGQIERGLLRRYGVEIRAREDIDRAGHHIRDAIRERDGTRIVVFVDLFCGWPVNKYRRNTAAQCLDFIFKLREETKNTAGEVVFVLVHHSSAMPNFQPELTDAFGSASIQRLSHYFEIHSDLNRLDLDREIDVTWAKVQRELMRVTHA